jgi:predicted ATPase
VRGLADAGVLCGSPGAFRFEGDSERLHVPASIQGVIASRVDGLARRLKATLQLAATVGAQFSLGVLRELQSESHAQLDDDLEELGRLGFLDLAPGGTDGLCRFQHALIHQVVYESVPARVCSERHARIVRIIEQLYAERIAEHRSELAEHALRGELWTDAARYLLQASIDAHVHSASREVVHSFERTLKTLERMPQSPAIQRCAIDMRLVTIGALIPLGDHARLAQILSEGERIAEQLQDDRRLALIYNQQALALWLRGGYARALQLTARSAAIATALGHTPLYLATRFLAGQTHHSRGEYRECIAAQLEVVRADSGEAAEQRAGWSAYPSVLSRTYLIHAHVQLGLAEAAQPYAEEAIALAERFGHGFSQAYLRVGVGPWLLAVGRTEEALALLRGALQLCSEHDLRTLVPLVCARLAVAQLEVADLAGAQRTLQPVLNEAALRATAHCNWIDVHWVASELRLRQGELSAASELSRIAEALCLQSESLGQLAHVLETRARIERAAGRDGESCAARARELCRRLQLAPLERRLAALEWPCAEPAPQPTLQRGDRNFD